MAVVVRPCKYCRTPFPSKTQRALYCSQTCNKEYHRQKKRQLINLDAINPSAPEHGLQEEQRQQDTAEYLQAYIARHMHYMTPEMISEELQVPLFAVKMQWPNPAR